MLNLAIDAISKSSVETITSSKQGKFKAVSIVQLMRGLFANILMFFRGSLFEPPRAGINAMIFIDLQSFSIFAVRLYRFFPGETDTL